jgi:glycosyltransferase
MKVSIVTVVYNNERTIEDAINSVLNQSYKNVEYIIIDGNSSDGTLSIVNRYQDRISRIVSEPDKGIYDAMNKGIGFATGDVIGILNSDDLYADDNVISDVAQCFQDNKSVDILYGDLVYVKATDTNKVVRKWNSLPYGKSYFERGNVPPHPTMFLKSKVYNESGRFDIQYKLAADYEFMLRIFKKHTFKSKYINRLMVKMRLGGATNKSFKNVLNGNREILNSWKRNGLKVPLLLMPIRIFKRLIQFI